MQCLLTILSQEAASLYFGVPQKGSHAAPSCGESVHQHDVTKGITSMWTCMKVTFQCAGVQSIEPLVERLDQAGVLYTKSMSGRPALFFRDPDMNVLEIGEMGGWRE